MFFFNKGFRFFLNWIYLSVWWEQETYPIKKCTSVDGEFDGKEKTRKMCSMKLTRYKKKNARMKENLLTDNSSEALSLQAFDNIHLVKPPT